MKYNEKNKPIQCMMTSSTWLKGAKTNSKPVGILWHDTGAGNPYIKRYVQPADNDPNKDELLKIIGTNIYKNDWNHIYREAGLNAWVGKLADGSVGSVQSGPWTTHPWGCGGGTKGSCNGYVVQKGVTKWTDEHWIQFEICDDNYSAKKGTKEYFEAVYKEACELTAYLCKLYNIDPKGYYVYNGVKVPTILCHKDSYNYKMGNNHGDIYVWFKKYGKDMNTVRNDVYNLLHENDKPTTTTSNVNTIKKGDLVKINANATYYNGKAIPAWVKANQWYVEQVSGSKVIINKSKDGKYAIMSSLYLSGVTKVSSATTTTNANEQKPQVSNKPSIKVGSLVKINSKAVYYSGKAIPTWVKNDQWYIVAISGSKAILGQNKSKTANIQSAIDVKYLTIVK